MERIEDKYSEVDESHKVVLLPPLSYYDALLLVLNAQKYPLNVEFKRFRMIMASFCSFNLKNIDNYQIMLSKFAKKGLIFYKREKQAYYPILTVAGEAHVDVILQRYAQAQQFMENYSKFLNE